MDWIIGLNQNKLLAFSKLSAKFPNLCYVLSAKKSFQELFDVYILVVCITSGYVVMQTNTIHLTICPDVIFSHSYWRWENWHFTWEVIMVYSSKLTSRTAGDVHGKGTDQILRLEVSSLDTVLEGDNTIGALAVGGLTGARFLLNCCSFRGRIGSHWHEERSPPLLALGDKFWLFIQTLNNAKKNIQFNIQLRNKIKLFIQRIHSFQKVPKFSFKETICSSEKWIITTRPW